MLNRSSNFKLQFRSPAIAAIRDSQSRETRRGERQCHSESRVAATTLQHLVLYLINCYMNSVHLRDFISLFSRYSCGEVRIYRKVINNRSTYLIKIYLLSFLNSILRHVVRRNIQNRVFSCSSFFSAHIYTCNL